MKELYVEYQDKFQAVREIAERYHISTETIDKCSKEIPDFRVTIPLIGAFSSGKSSLLNACLGEEILSTEVTPETAIPAEICYGKNSVTCYTENDSYSDTFESLLQNKDSAKQVRLRRIFMENEFLKKIPTVRIVDMPGFDSGFEAHERAISDYLPNSLAYIIVVSAEEGTLRNSVKNFIHELQLNSVPMYFVLTKSDKIEPCEIENVTEQIQSILRTKLQIQDVSVTVTSADDEETAEFKEILLDLQNKSDEIFQKHYRKQLCLQLHNIENYLQNQLKIKDYNQEKLEADKKQIEEEINTLEERLQEEKERFGVKADSSVKAISQKVKSDLNANRSMLENMVMQGQSIQNQVNTIVRNAVTTGLRTYFEPKMQQYLKDVSELVFGDIPMNEDTSPLISPEEADENRKTREAVRNAVDVGVTAIGIAIGTAIGGPIGGVIGAAVGALATVIGNAFSGQSRENEEQKKRDAAEQRVGQVISEVISSIGVKIENIISETIAKANEKIKKQFAEQVALKRQSIADIEANLLKNASEREENEKQIQQDLKQIQEMLTKEEL